MLRFECSLRLVARADREHPRKLEMRLADLGEKVPKHPLILRYEYAHDKDPTENTLTRGNAIARRRRTRMGAGRARCNTVSTPQTRSRDR
ncbi:hypothetical protein ASA1KI_02680 [Opitutales bacterium ASA1]|nr:hypothetical protein ASA1KI_02680 [Opitutales bacterium ASA1]